MSNSRLNAQQSEIPNSDWNPKSNLLKVFGFFRKNYFGFTFDEFAEYIAQLLFIIDVQKHLWDWLNVRQSEMFTEFRLKSSVKPIKSI